VVILGRCLGREGWQPAACDTKKIDGGYVKQEPNGVLEGEMGETD
jgi:hypothetical protein